MRRIVPLVLAGVSAGFLVASTAAEAQSRNRGPLRVTVQPRSYFDAGRVAPAGSLSRYAITPTFLTSPAYSFQGDRFGEGVLPPRIGGGRNAFGPIGN